MVLLLHRTIGFAALSGRGLERGALHKPAHLSRGTSVRHFDVVGKSQAHVACYIKSVATENSIKCSGVGMKSSAGPATAD